MLAAGWLVAAKHALCESAALIARLTFSLRQPTAAVPTVVITMHIMMALVRPAAFVGTRRS
jgi:hypothetical protein